MRRLARRLVAWIERSTALVAVVLTLCAAASALLVPAGSLVAAADVQPAGAPASTTTGS